MLLRPLYGARDAPLRWHLETSQIMVSGGYKPMKGDRCASLKHIADDNSSHPFAITNHKIVAAILLHVDDVIFAGAPSEYSRFTSIMNTLRHSGIEVLSPQNFLVFCGITIAVESAN